MRDHCDTSRDLAIVDLLASTGMRVGELVALNKKDIVKAKYIYIILFTLIGAIIGITLSIILQMIKTKEGVNMENIISTSIGALFGMMILQMFQIPIIYKFGAEKGRLIQMIGIVIIMIIGSSITVFFIKVSPFSLDEFFLFILSRKLKNVRYFCMICYLIAKNIFISQKQGFNFPCAGF